MALNIQPQLCAYVRPVQVYALPLLRCGTAPAPAGAEPSGGCQCEDAKDIYHVSIRDDLGVLAVNSVEALAGQFGPVRHAVERSGAVYGTLVELADEQLHVGVPSVHVFVESSSMY